MKVQRYYYLPKSLLTVCLLCSSQLLLADPCRDILLETHSEKLIADAAARLLFAIQPEFRVSPNERRYKAPSTQLIGEKSYQIYGRPYYFRGEEYIDFLSKEQDSTILQSLPVRSFLKQDPKFFARYLSPGMTHVLVEDSALSNSALKGEIFKVIEATAENIKLKNFAGNEVFVSYYELGRGQLFLDDTRSMDLASEFFADGGQGQFFYYTSLTSPIIDGWYISVTKLPRTLKSDQYTIWREDADVREFLISALAAGRPLFFGERRKGIAAIIDDFWSPLDSYEKQRLMRMLGLNSALPPLWISPKADRFSITHENVHYHDTMSGRVERIYTKLRELDVSHESTLSIQSFILEFRAIDTEIAHIYQAMKTLSTYLTPMGRDHFRKVPFQGSEGLGVWRIQQAKEYLESYAKDASLALVRIKKKNALQFEQVKTLIEYETVDTTEQLSVSNFL